MNWELHYFMKFVFIILQKFKKRDIFSPIYHPLILGGKNRRVIKMMNISLWLKFNKGVY